MKMRIMNNFLRKSDMFKKNKTIDILDEYLKPSESIYDTVHHDLRFGNPPPNTHFFIDRKEYIKYKNKLYKDNNIDLSISQFRESIKEHDEYIQMYKSHMKTIYPHLHNLIDSKLPRSKFLYNHDVIFENDPIKKQKAFDLRSGWKYRK